MTRVSNHSGFEIFNGIKRAIFVAAHPDDAEGCAGGTIYKLTLQGVEIFSVTCTSGNIGTHDRQISREELASLRAEEADEAAKILGVTRTFKLGYDDGELEPTLQLRSRLAELYRVTQADTLFTFDPSWSDDLHPDHRSAGQAALDAVIPSKMPHYHVKQLKNSNSMVSCIKQIFLFYPERNPTVDVIVDVTDVYSVKVNALLSHRSQFPQPSNVLKWLEDWNRETGSLINVAFAEGFKSKKIF